MKPPRERNPKAIKIPVKGRANKGGMGGQTTKVTTQHCQQEPGKDNGDFFNEKDKHLSPSESVKSLDLELYDNLQLPVPIKRMPFYGIHGGKPLLPDSKIKLQLFPLNEGIRIGLEKDGFHPYLELTLKPRKKISSILNHLNNKWGSSSAALGEPVLFPYRIHENVSSKQRWTLNDGGVSAGEVYAATGSPEVFRLRYGWLSNEHITSDKPSTSACDKVDLQSKDIKRNTSTPGKNAYEVDGKYVVVDSEANISIGGLLSEVSLQDKCNNEDMNYSEKTQAAHSLDIKSDSESFKLWSDCPSISIGGILSEISLQGKISHFGSHSTASNPNLQPAPDHTKSDSPHGSKSSTNGPCLSILDAEETCHAFSSQKFSMGKDVMGFGGSSEASCLNSGFNLFKFPTPAKSDTFDELPQDRAQQESNTEWMNNSYLNNDERSLGLSGIRWNDSLGPFDLGLPVIQKLCNADSTSISGFLK